MSASMAGRRTLAASLLRCTPSRPPAHLQLLSLRRDASTSRSRPGVRWRTLRIATEDEPVSTATHESPTQPPTNTPPSVIRINGKRYPTDEWFNVPAGVLAATDRKLHLQKDHPIAITRQILESVFPPPTFRYYNDFHPVVTPHQNFDSLGFPPDHPGRARSDTYYINANRLLRTHTSAHESFVFAGALSRGFLISADVYRRDDIDRSHYPVFHQMEGARVWSTRVPPAEVEAAVVADLARLPTHDVAVEDPNPPFHPTRNPLQQAEHHTPEVVAALAAHLKRSLELMVVKVFSHARAAARAANPDFVDEPLRVRWVEAYFPFTSPSWEMEVYFGGAWLEVLGCGITQQQIHVDAGRQDQLGWAFGIGLDRIAMLLFQIPDIRLFWSRDPRFTSQFEGVSDDLNKLRQFVPFSRYPPCYKDVSFWLRGTAGSPAGGKEEVHGNDVMEVIRGVAGDTVEDVVLTDEFTHPETGRMSRCYRVNYRSLERTLTNEETNELHAKVAEALVEKLGVEIR